MIDDAERDAHERLKQRLDELRREYPDIAERADACIRWQETMMRSLMKDFERQTCRPKEAFTRAVVLAVIRKAAGSVRNDLEALWYNSG